MIFDSLLHYIWWPESQDISSEPKPLKRVETASLDIQGRPIIKKQTAKLHSKVMHWIETSQITILTLTKQTKPTIWHRERPKDQQFSWWTSLTAVVSGYRKLKLQNHRHICAAPTRADQVKAGWLQWGWPWALIWGWGVFFKAAICVPSLALDLALCDILPSNHISQNLGCLRPLRINDDR